MQVSSLCILFTFNYCTQAVLGEVLNYNHGDTMTTINHLLNEKFSARIPPSPPPSLPLLPFPHKQIPHSSFSNVSPRFSPYTYPNRYSSSLLTPPYYSSLFSHFPPSPFSLPLPLPTPELERSHSPVLPDSPASPIVMERNEYCRDEGGVARH